MNAHVAPTEVVARIGWPELLDQHERILRELRAVDDAWAEASWREAAKQYHRDRAGRTLSVVTEPRRLAQLRRLMADDVSLDRAWHELNDTHKRPTPKASIDAVWHAFLERGVAALSQPEVMDRIAHCDEDARAELDRRIATIKVEVGR
jgi:hypothetical protein